MLHRHVKGLSGLAGEGAARHVDDGTGDHDWQPRAARLLVVFIDGEEGRLGVERIEDGLDQNDVSTTINQASNLRLVGSDDLIPRAVAEARILDGRRDRQGAVGRADGAGDEARTGGFRSGDLLGSVNSKLACHLVQLVHHVLHTVVGLSDHRTRERVRLANVGTARKVAAVDLPNGIGLREDKQVIVALELLRLRHVGELVTAEVRLGELVLLNSGAHGTIDDHDALLHGVLDVLGNLVGILLARDAPRQVGP
mmetsp:Transcript_17649/g.35512  ORF Transcript_17649/g.35512 Transcript_17649/m.35512 type:complete len:254 (+) Transcript_17649:3428-4189(+)